MLKNDTTAALASGAVAYKMTAATNGVNVSFTRSVYDWDGRVVYAMAASGAVTEYRYDAAGRRTNVLVYTNYFVSLSSSTTAIAPTGGALSTVYRYDANGNQTAVIDAAGRETDFAYDAANRLI